MHACDSPAPECARPVLSWAAFCLLSSPGPWHEIAANPPPQTVAMWLGFTVLTNLGAVIVYLAIASSSIFVANLYSSAHIHSDAKDLSRSQGIG